MNRTTRMSSAFASLSILSLPCLALIAGGCGGGGAGGSCPTIQAPTVQVTPEPLPCAGGEVIVCAVVTDPDSAIASVLLTLVGPGGSTDYAMALAAADTYCTAPIAVPPNDTAEVQEYTGTVKAVNTQACGRSEGPFLVTEVPVCGSPPPPPP